MDFPDQFIADFFVAPVQDLRHGRAGDATSVGELRIGDLLVVHEDF